MCSELTASSASLAPSTASAASIALVIPSAFTRRASELVSIELSSTPTAKTPEEAASPSPAIAVARSAIASFFEVLSSASMIAMLSAPTATAAAVNSLRSRAITPPEAESPSPASSVATSS